MKNAQAFYRAKLINFPEEIMQDDSENQTKEVNEVETLKQQLAEAQKSIDALVAKKDELLKETKAAKEEKRKQAEVADKARQEQLTTAQKNGEFEKLWKSAEEEKETYKNELFNYKKELKQQAINVKAEKIALDLTNKDPDKAELLKDFIANSLNKLAGEDGIIDDEVLLSVKKQFETDKKYAPLLGTNKSVGGSAQGNTRSVSASQTMNRAEFDKMPLHKQSDYMSKVLKGQAELTD